MGRKYVQWNCIDSWSYPNAPSDLQPHYGNGFFINVYLIALDNTYLEVNIAGTLLPHFRNGSCRSLGAIFGCANSCCYIFQFFCVFNSLYDLSVHGHWSLEKLFAKLDPISWLVKTQCSGTYSYFEWECHKFRICWYKPTDDTKKFYRYISPSTSPIVRLVIPVSSVCMIWVLP